MLALGRKAMTNLDSILKSRDTLPTKVSLVKTMVFPVIYGCESWTIKKAECQRMFKLLYNRFYFIGSKITEDGDYSHETNLDSILKCRDIILLTKIHLVKAMVFPNNHVQM